MSADNLSVEVEFVPGKVIGQWARDENRSGVEAMDQCKRLLLIAALSICTVTQPAGAQASEGKDDSPKYRQGHDPTSTDRKALPAIPADAWGKAVNGLQAALSAPATIRLNEVLTLHVVVRNVSDRTIRVSLPQHPDILSFRRDGTTISYSVNKPRGQVHSWELKPGHQTNIPSAPVQVLAPGNFGLNRALTRLSPGRHTLYARTGTSDHWWVPDTDETSRKVFPREGEWTGWLSMPRRPIEVLDEKVPFSISPLEDLPPDHGLKHVVGRPESISNGHTEWIRIRDGLEFALDCSQDAHWLLDYGTYNRIVSWGPIPAAKLNKLKLLDRIRRLSQKYMAAADHNSQVSWRIEVLVRSGKPLAAMGLQFVPKMKLPKPEKGIPSDDLVRAIRGRRVELEDMGLAAPMQRALHALSAHDAPMPDDSQFKVILDKGIPVEFKDVVWGPKNAGLQAAALMPDSLKAEATVNVRLFIRNVSDHDVRLAVSKRAGYDYATAIDSDGNQLKSIRPYVYPGAFASVIMPELNPGQMTQSPPTATLQRVLLKPGALLQLETKTSLSFHLPERKTGRFFVSMQDDGKPAVTHISAKPTPARVTWHMHAANGTAYSGDLKRRLWPAKGSWSGILTTAPTEIHLRP